MKPAISCLLARILSFLFIASMLTMAAERPNILWITAEDYSADWLGCYGNTQAQTPRLDSLAREGILFTHAFSNAAVCAVARSTILNGAYAPTQGTQHMRSRKPIPAKFRPYLSYLHQLGYSCFNSGKTDYNYTVNDASLWDKSGWGYDFLSTYKPDGKKPFFAIYNLGVTHESALFAKKIQANRQHGIIPPQPRISPDKVIVPPYLPDLPEIRSDLAIYHDCITAMDTQVGEILDKLKKKGLADDTIIFHYGDHGGILPRSKRYLKDTGVRVSLIVYFPKKWQHLNPFKPGSRVSETVSFVDLAPTLLSLIGEEKPSQMQGRAFLGSHRIEPKRDATVFLYADRFDEIYGMRRGLSDGRWKYIRRFTPELPAAPNSFYQFGQAGWRAWLNASHAHRLAPRFNKIWQPHQEVEELFDTRNDPWEIHNLATVPKYADQLNKMRAQLQAKMVEVADTGLIPEAMFAELSRQVPSGAIADYLAVHSAELPALVELAFRASSRDSKHLPHFANALQSKVPVTRFWGAQGYLNLGKQARSASHKLLPLLNDPSPAVIASAADALITIGTPKEARAALLRLTNELDPIEQEFAYLYTLNVLSQHHLIEQMPAAKIQHLLDIKNKKNYVRKFIERYKKQQQLEQKQ